MPGGGFHWEQAIGADIFGIFDCDVDCIPSSSESVELLKKSLRLDVCQLRLVPRFGFAQPS